MFVMVWLTKFVLLISLDSAMGSYNLKIEQQPSRKRSGHVTLVTCTLCSCMYKCIIDQTALLHVRQGSCHSNSALAALCLHSCACSQRSLTSPSSHFLVSASKSPHYCTCRQRQTDRNRQEITSRQSDVHTVGIRPVFS